MPSQSITLSWLPTVILYAQNQLQKFDSGLENLHLFIIQLSLIPFIHKNTQLIDQNASMDKF
jgi:hypothetical protein